MADIHPFPALLFHPLSGTDITSLVAPPYDVIDSAGRAELEGRSPTNIVRLILPSGAPGQSRYETAAQLFHDWLRDGRLVTREDPALYLWEQAFRYGDRDYRRRALVARVACRPYGVGGIMRHEHTQAAVREERLRLFQATGAQFSQIFGIFSDPEGKVAAQLAAAANGDPLLTARGDDGHTSSLHPITGAETITRLQVELSGATITIADGHHRYETSLAYFQSRGRSGRTLMTLVPDSDTGLVVLPTHRTVALSLDHAALPQALGPEFAVAFHPIEDWPRLYGQGTAQPGGGELLALAPGSSQVAAIRWDAVGETNAGLLNFGGAAVLHGLLLPRLQPGAELAPEAFGYHHDAHDAVAVARERGHWTFLLQPTSVETLLKVAEQQAVLPTKSTYFYPKFLAGFVNARLD